MRPKVQFLRRELVEQIIAEARDILGRLGVEIHNEKLVATLLDHGAVVEKDRVLLKNDLIDRALESAPESFALYDVLGNLSHELRDNQVHFTPGSAAIRVLDHHTGDARPPLAEDYRQYTQVVSQMEFIKAQSTAIIPTDVDQQIADSYRLFLSLLYCEKPVVTGAFTIEGFEVMKDLQLAVRGSRGKLRAKPLTIFSCCPTAPLKWSDVTSQNTIDCAEYSIPVEFISMPLAGFMSPVTLVGSLVQHTAETLSGIVISQVTNPGTPVIYGGSPAIFDIRYQTTPMGAIETMMLDCAYCEIGKYLRLPTQAYIALSDAKQLDAQAGLETSMGATLASLAGINSISGPGMLDFESCFSLEKLVLDNQICGMVSRLVEGIQPREDFPSIGHFEELLEEKHLLISDHTRKYLNQEHYFPAEIIDRANRSRWTSDGEKTLEQRARQSVDTLFSTYTPSRLDSSIQREMVSRMESAAKACGMDHLPELNP